MDCRLAGEIVMQRVAQFLPIFKQIKKEHGQCSEAEYYTDSIGDQIEAPPGEILQSGSDIAGDIGDKLINAGLNIWRKLRPHRFQKIGEITHHGINDFGSIVQQLIHRIDEDCDHITGDQDN